jgi:hypothetical protein
MPATRRLSGLAPMLAMRLAQAHASGNEESAGAYRAALKAAGYAARIATPHQLAEAIRDWPKEAAGARRKGLVHALIVPIPGQIEPLVIAAIDHLRRDPSA